MMDGNENYGVLGGPKHFPKIEKHNTIILTLNELFGIDH